MALGTQLALELSTRLAVLRDSPSLPPDAAPKPHLGLEKTDFPRFPLRQQ